MKVLFGITSRLQGDRVPRSFCLPNLVDSRLPPLFAVVGSSDTKVYRLINLTHSCERSSVIITTSSQFQCKVHGPERRQKKTSKSQAFIRPCSSSSSYLKNTLPLSTDHGCAISRNCVNNPHRPSVD